MFRLFGHYVSKLYLLLGVIEFLVMFYSFMAGFYMRFAISGWRRWRCQTRLSYTAMAFAASMLVAMISVGLYQRGLPFSAGLLVRIGLSFLIANVAMSVVFYTFPDWRWGGASWPSPCCSPWLACWVCAACFSASRMASSSPIPCWCSAQVAKHK